MAQHVADAQRLLDARDISGMAAALGRAFERVNVTQPRTWPIGRRAVDLVDPLLLALDGAVTPGQCQLVRRAGVFASKVMHLHERSVLWLTRAVTLADQDEVPGVLSDAVEAAAAAGDGEQALKWSGQLLDAVGLSERDDEDSRDDSGQRVSDSRGVVRAQALVTHADALLAKGMARRSVASLQRAHRLLQALAAATPGKATPASRAVAAALTQCLRQMGVAYSLMQQNNESLAALRAALKQSPAKSVEQACVLFHLGSAYQAGRDAVAARKHFELARDCFFAADARYHEVFLRVQLALASCYATAIETKDRVTPTLNDAEATVTAVYGKQHALHVTRLAQTALLFAAMGGPTRGISVLQDAMAMIDALPSQAVAPVMRAYAAISLGVLFFKTDDDSRAEPLLQSGLALVQQQGQRSASLRAMAEDTLRQMKLRRWWRMVRPVAVPVALLASLVFLVVLRFGWPPSFLA